MTPQMIDIVPLKLGELVPDFELDTYDPVKDDFGKVSLATLRRERKWSILVFYPADFTFVCATEFAALAEQYDDFQKLGAEVITVSCDTKFTHLAWKKGEQELAGVRYPMAADPAGKLARALGVYDESSGMALRGTFLINPEGKLLGSEVNFYNVGRNIDELMRKFRAYLHVAAHGDEACPAKWRDTGDKTLKPSAKMVGKVHEALKG